MPWLFQFQGAIKEDTKNSQHSCSKYKTTQEAEKKETLLSLSQMDTKVPSPEDPAAVDKVFNCMKNVLHVGRKTEYACSFLPMLYIFKSKFDRTQPWIILQKIPINKNTNLYCTVFLILNIFIECFVKLFVWPLWFSQTWDYHFVFSCHLYGEF